MLTELTISFLTQPSNVTGSPCIVIGLILVKSLNPPRKNKTNRQSISDHLQLEQIHTNTYLKTIKSALLLKITKLSAYPDIDKAAHQAKSMTL